MNRKMIPILCVLLLSFFTMGCHSDRNCNCSSTIIAEISEPISETSFQQGLIVKETTIEVKTEDKELLTTVTLKEDTQFEDKNGVAITKAPVLVVKTTKEGDVSKSVIKFTNVKGEVVTPTKPFKVGIKAPSSANARDRVKVEVPETSTTQIQKILIRVVSESGFIFLEITINDYQNAITVISITLLGNGATN